MVDVLSFQRRQEFRRWLKLKGRQQKLTCNESSHRRNQKESKINNVLTGGGSNGSDGEHSGSDESSETHSLSTRFSLFIVHIKLGFSSSRQRWWSSSPVTAAMETSTEVLAKMVVVALRTTAASPFFGDGETRLEDDDGGGRRCAAAELHQRLSLSLTLRFFLSSRRVCVSLLLLSEK
ncbi:hypothetical protein PIB30_073168 [Stylosanthes scabra]|uniref:Uncharacterized protein n=1 Tax=Stylosanthes scabra TaxID=79078 RepID=A0ABU6XM64_9FABA|nr:hypothetical protein [Stylosanthes scabra]